MNKPCRFKVKKRFHPVNIIVTKEKAVPSELQNIVEPKMVAFYRELLEDLQFEDHFTTVIVHMNNPDEDRIERASSEKFFYQTIERDTME